MIDPTRTSINHQRHRVETYRQNSNGYQFFNLLTSDELLDLVD